MTAVHRRLMLDVGLATAVLAVAVFGVVFVVDGLESRGPVAARLVRNMALLWPLLGLVAGGLVLDWWQRTGRWRAFLAVGGNPRGAAVACGLVVFAMAMAPALLDAQTGVAPEWVVREGGAYVSAENDLTVQRQGDDLVFQPYAPKNGEQRVRWSAALVMAWSSFAWAALVFATPSRRLGSLFTVAVCWRLVEVGVLDVVRRGFWSEAYLWPATGALAAIVFAALWRSDRSAPA